MDGRILERDVERKVPPADAHPRRVTRDERTGDAEVGTLAEQPLGIEHAEGEPDDGGYRGERDVALGEAQSYADDLAPDPAAAANMAGVRNRGGIGAGAGSGEREAGNLLAAGEPRQEVLALLVRAVVQDQLGRAERVRHHGRDRGGGTAAR